MRPHPRIRKTIKWGGLALTVLLVAVWIGTNWFTLIWGGRSPHSWDLSIGGGNLTTDYGVVELEWGSYPVPDENLGIHLRYTKNSLASGFGWGVSRPAGMIQTPLWPLVVACAACTLIAFWVDARFPLPRPGQCPRCRYDRSGLASKNAVCPECGEGAPPAISGPPR